MSTYYLAAARGYSEQPQPIPKLPIPTLTLESMHGDVQIQLNGTQGWVLMPGATGLGLAPSTVISDIVPMVPGSVFREARVLERPIFLPLYCGSNGDQITFREMLDQMYELVDPSGQNQFKIVGRSYRGSREMTVTYLGGLEGADGADVAGLSWCKVGLLCVAHDPYPRSRVSRSLEFRAASAGTPFMGVAGASDAPFPVSLSSGSVIGSGMTITIGGQVPVYPTLRLTGPMDSFSGTLLPTVVEPNGHVHEHTEHTWSVDVPAGVPAGQTLTYVTDPRARSVRLGTGLAAGRIARGSSIRPFYPGDNTLNVVAPGGTDDTRIYIDWTEQYRALW